MTSVNLTRLRRMKEEGEKIVSLTAYDVSFARLLDEAGVEVVLVGDSVGMVVQGHATTVPVTMDDMVYHTAAVARGVQRAFIVADMPFASYGSPEQALHNAARLMQAGAHMVKLEVRRSMLETVRYLSEFGVPVCAHLGLLPQTVHKLGGYKVQARERESAKDLIEDAVAMEEAGADLLLLELVPSLVAAEVSRTARVPVIGIGAGVECDGQVLVLHDMLGITPGKRPRFSKDFLAENGSVAAAVAAYVQAVKGKTFPAAEHSFAS